MEEWQIFKQLGIAIGHYRPTKDYHMPVCVGDAIHIVEASKHWYRGFLIRDRSVKGIVPKDFVYIRESTVEKIGHYETLTPKDPPIVQEITSVLREWGVILQQLFIQNDTEKYFGIRALMLQLMSLRRDMMSKKLTKDDFNRKQLEATSKIDYGNELLELDLTIRNEDGDIINSENIGSIELYRDHKRTVERNKMRLHSEAETKAIQKHTLNLFVKVNNVICRVGDEADVIMSLYDKKQSRFFSENCVIRWTSKGLPENIDLINNIRILFSDLGKRDLKAERESVFLVCQVIRLGEMNPPLENESRSKGQKYLRRPFGVAALDVTDVLNGSINPDEDKQHFIPILPCNKKDIFIEDVIKAAVEAKEVTQRTHKGQGVWVSVKLLEGHLKEVRECYPHLFVYHPIVARKMGFPEVIMPYDVRNDFYVTINHGNFSRDSGKLAERNIEVNMQVCSRDGKPLMDVISVGGGTELQSKYQSVVYRHQDDPHWFETFKVAVPYADFYNCHLKFIFKHRSDNDVAKEKDFALSYVSFTRSDRTILPDGDHDLLVYSIDSKKSSENVCYLELPSMKSELDKEEKNHKYITKGPFSLSKKDTFQIATLSCSTKLTHNSELLGLLDWKENKDALHLHLMNLMKVDGDEIVKFLQDVLDALFIIYTESSQTDQYDSPIFNALIFVIGLISERKYQQFRPVLELYINDIFCSTYAYTKLIKVFKEYLDNADNETFHDIIFRSFKSINYLMKLIVRSRQHYAMLNENKASVPFEMSMKQLFQSMCALMCYSSTNSLKIQGAALKYIPSVIPDIINNKVIDRREFTQLLLQLLRNIPKDRLTNQKLQCIVEIVNSPLFRFPEPRGMLLADIVEILWPEISGYTENLEVSAQILSDILLHISSIPGAEDDIVFLFSGKDLLRTVIQTVINMDRKNVLVPDFTTIMLSMLRQMTEEQYKLYMSQIPEAAESNANLVDFLTEIILVFRDLIKERVYPKDWNEMIMAQNKVILKALRCFSQTIKEKFAAPFEQHLWNNFFHCAITFLTQDVLQLENFSSSKRRKIIARYGDMRRAMGFEIRSMWFNLGQQKITFIPGLVGPFLEMTLIPEPELRKATLPLFFDMMLCEFSQTSDSQPFYPFRQFEHELITQIDAQVEGGNGDEQYTELFYISIRELCSKHQHLNEYGCQFVDTIRKLLLRLLEYRNFIHDENKDNRMNCIVNLLNFYRDIDRQEMYIRYLHKLCDLHLECSNYTEAAHTLLLYTSLLKWTDEQLDPLLRGDLYPSAQTHRELKILLYHKILEHYEKGKMWEKGIALCKELEEQYEMETLDYEHLTSLLQKRAEFYTKILYEPRYSPGYYRVCYYGCGFPSFLSNKVFIYRGKDCEQLSDFTSRIRELFPNAKQLTTLNNPGRDVTESAGQYLQVNAVNPIFEPQDRFMNKRVSERILSYWKFNEIRSFFYSRPVKHASDITKLWLERTDLYTETELPGILRWFQVTEQATYKVSPLRNALDSLITRNDELEALIEEHKRLPDLKLGNLNMKLGGICDAAVNGGLANYKPFFNGVYQQAIEGEPEDEQKIKQQELSLIDDLKRVILDQFILVADGLKIFDEKCTDDLRNTCNYLIERFGDQITDATENFKITFPAYIYNIRKDKAQNAAIMRHTNAELAIGDVTPLRKMSSTPEKLTRTSSNSIFKPSLRERSPSKSALTKANSIRISTGSKDSKDSSDSSDKKSDGPVIDITQPLTPARPPRPETKTSKPRASGSSLKSKLQLQLSLPNYQSGTNTIRTSAGSETSMLTPIAGSATPPSADSQFSDKFPLNGRVVRSNSVKGTVSEPVMINYADCLTNDVARVMSAGNPHKLDASRGLHLNNSFDDNSMAMTSSPAMSHRRFTSPTGTFTPPLTRKAERSDVPPPLPQKQNVSDHSIDGKQSTPKVVLRQNSHKGMPPPALPTSYYEEHAVAPPLPEKRSSIGSKSDHSSS